MELPVLDQVLAQLRATLERDDLQAAAAIIQAYQPADQADLFWELEEDEQVALLPALDPADSADILAELDEEQAAELVAALSTETVIRIVEQMEPDEAADLLGDIAPEQAEAVLSGLEDPEEVQPLLLHSDDSAGGLMTSDFLALRRRMTAAEAIAALRKWKPEAETVYYLFVVDQLGRLAGMVSLRQLIVAEPETRLMDLMNPAVVSVRDGADQEEAARLMSRYDLLALPVVDAANTLLGVITIDDVMDVLEQEVTEDIHRLGGTQPLDRSYLDTPPTTITRKRIGWLLLLFLIATLTGSVMRLFQDQLQAVVALAAFIPLLIGTGGNAGSQTTATIIRALATKDIEPRNAFAVWWHEARVGIALGVGVALAAFVLAYVWGYDYQLGLAVALSALGIIVWANSVGAILPFIAARVGIDPAVVSGPLMTTLVDTTGLLIYFVIAQLVLGW